MEAKSKQTTAEEQHKQNIDKLNRELSELKELLALKETKSIEDNQTIDKLVNITLKIKNTRMTN